MYWADVFRQGTLQPGQTISVNKFNVQVERYLSQGACAISALCSLYQCRIQVDLLMYISYELLRLCTTPRIMSSRGLPWLTMLC